MPPEDASGILEVLDVQKNKCFCLQGTGLVTVPARGGRLPQPGRHPAPGRPRQLLAWGPERLQLLTPPSCLPSVFPTGWQFRGRTGVGRRGTCGEGCPRREAPGLTLCRASFASRFAAGGGQGSSQSLCCWGASWAAAVRGAGASLPLLHSSSSTSLYLLTLEAPGLLSE